MPPPTQSSAPVLMLGNYKVTSLDDISRYSDSLLSNFQSLKDGRAEANEIQQGLKSEAEIAAYSLDEKLVGLDRLRFFLFHKTSTALQRQVGLSSLLKEIAIERHSSTAASLAIAASSTPALPSNPHRSVSATLLFTHTAASTSAFSSLASFTYPSVFAAATPASAFSKYDLTPEGTRIVDSLLLTEISKILLAHTTTGAAPSSAVVSLLELDSQQKLAATFTELIQHRAFDRSKLENDIVPLLLRMLDAPPPPSVLASSSSTSLPSSSSSSNTSGRDGGGGPNSSRENNSGAGGAAEEKHEEYLTIWLQPLLASIEVLGTPPPPASLSASFSAANSPFKPSSLLSTSILEFSLKGKLNDSSKKNSTQFLLSQPMYVRILCVQIWGELTKYIEWNIIRDRLLEPALAMCQDTSGAVRFHMCRHLVSFIQAMSNICVHSKHAPPASPFPSSSTAAATALSTPCSLCPPSAIVNGTIDSSHPLSMILVELEELLKDEEREVKARAFISFIQSMDFFPDLMRKNKILPILRSSLQMPPKGLLLLFAGLFGIILWKTKQDLLLLPSSHGGDFSSTTLSPSSNSTGSAEAQASQLAKTLIAFYKNLPFLSSNPASLSLPSPSSSTSASSSNSTNSSSSDLLYSPTSPQRFLSSMNMNVGSPGGGTGVFSFSSSSIQAAAANNSSVSSSFLSIPTNSLVVTPLNNNNTSLTTSNPASEPRRHCASAFVALLSILGRVGIAGTGSSSSSAAGAALSASPGTSECRFFSEQLSSLWHKLLRDDDEEVRFIVASSFYEVVACLSGIGSSITQAIFAGSSNNSSGPAGGTSPNKASLNSVAAGQNQQIVIAPTMHTSCAFKLTKDGLLNLLHECAPNNSLITASGSIATGVNSSSGSNQVGSAGALIRSLSLNSGSGSAIGSNIVGGLPSNAAGGHSQALEVVLALMEGGKLESIAAVYHVNHFGLNWLPPSSSSTPSTSASTSASGGSGAASSTAAAASSSLPVGTSEAVLDSWACFLHDLLRSLLLVESSLSQSYSWRYKLNFWRSISFLFRPKFVLKHSTQLQAWITAHSNTGGAGNNPANYPSAHYPHNQNHIRSPSSAAFAQGAAYGVSAHHPLLVAALQPSYLGAITSLHILGDLNNYSLLWDKFVPLLMVHMHSAPTPLKLLATELFLTFLLYTPFALRRADAHQRFIREFAYSRSSWDRHIFIEACRWMLGLRTSTLTLPNAESLVNATSGKAKEEGDEELTNNNSVNTNLNGLGSVVNPASLPPLMKKPVSNRLFKKLFFLPLLSLVTDPVIMLRRKLLLPSAPISIASSTTPSSSSSSSTSPGEGLSLLQAMRRMLTSHDLSLHESLSKAIASSRATLGDGDKEMIEAWKSLEKCMNENLVHPNSITVPSTTGSSPPTVVLHVNSPITAGFEDGFERMREQVEESLLKQEERWLVDDRHRHIMSMSGGNCSLGLTAVQSANNWAPVAYEKNSGAIGPSSGSTTAQASGSASGTTGTDGKPLLKSKRASMGATGLKSMTDSAVIDAAKRKGLGNVGAGGSAASANGPNASSASSTSATGASSSGGNTASSATAAGESKTNSNASIASRTSAAVANKLKAKGLSGMNSGSHAGQPNTPTASSTANAGGGGLMMPPKTIKRYGSSPSSVPATSTTGGGGATTTTSGTADPRGSPNSSPMLTPSMKPPMPAPPRIVPSAMPVIATAAANTAANAAAAAAASSPVPTPPANVKPPVSSNAAAIASILAAKQAAMPAPSQASTSQILSAATGGMGLTNVSGASTSNSAASTIVGAGGSAVPLGTRPNRGAVDFPSSRDRGEKEKEKERFAAFERNKPFESNGTTPQLAFVPFEDSKVTHSSDGGSVSSLPLPRNISSAGRVRNVISIPHTEASSQQQAVANAKTSKLLSGNLSLNAARIVASSGGGGISVSASNSPVPSSPSLPGSSFNTRYSGAPSGVSSLAASGLGRAPSPMLGRPRVLGPTASIGGANSRPPLSLHLPTGGNSSSSHINTSGSASDRSNEKDHTNVHLSGYAQTAATLLAFGADSLSQQVAASAATPSSKRAGVAVAGVFRSSTMISKSDGSNNSPGSNSPGRNGALPSPTSAAASAASSKLYSKEPPALNHMRKFKRGQQGQLPSAEALRSEERQLKAQQHQLDEFLAAHSHSTSSTHGSTHSSSTTNPSSISSSTTPHGQPHVRRRSQGALSIQSSSLVLAGRNASMK